MAHYKKDAASNRDALFGGGGGSSKRSLTTNSKSSRAQRPSSTSISTAASRPKESSSSSGTAAAAIINTAAHTTNTIITSSTSANNTSNDITPGPSIIFASHGRSAARNNSANPLSILTGQAKISKMAEAEDYRLKAKKAMTRGIFFTKPDPISASNYYKRAADAYKSCGENRLERLHRIASGDCQLGQDAYATAASEYTRAAELAEMSDETLGRKRQECHKLHLDAANAWSSMGERGRAAESMVKAAFGLVMGEPCHQALDDTGSSSGSGSGALKSVEEAIEAFVPDPLNRKADYRRTGVSAYRSVSIDQQQSSSSELELAKQNIITDAFAHETLFKVGNELIKRRHYESALYAYGAGTASLEHEGYATVSLYRSYLSETIIMLAMGDTVAASREFTGVHLQSTSYLSSRECALEEDLIRACDGLDTEALEEARSREGQHRGAMANLDATLRELVGEIRVSGRARKEKQIQQQQKQQQQNQTMVKKQAEKVPSSATPSSNAAVIATDTGPLHSPTEPTMNEKTGDELLQEMDDIMNQMGLDDDDDDDDEEDEEDEEDDDIDLT